MAETGEVGGEVGGEEEALDCQFGSLVSYHSTNSPARKKVKIIRVSVAPGKRIGRWKILLTKGSLFRLKDFQITITHPPFSNLPPPPADEVRPVAPNSPIWLVSTVVA